MHASQVLFCQFVFAFSSVPAGQPLRTVGKDVGSKDGYVDGENVGRYDGV